MGGAKDDGSAGGGEQGLPRIVGRRRAVLDDDAEPPHLRLTGDPSVRRDQLLVKKQRAEQIVDDTSAELARCFAHGSARSAVPRPAMGRMTLILPIVALILLAPRLFGIAAAGLTGGLRFLVPAIVIGGGMYAAGRWFARRRASTSTHAAALALGHLEADARRRLQSIIDEWFRIDDTLGIGTVLESAYARQPRLPELDRTWRAVIASIDAAMTAGHEALVELGDGSPVERLHRVDAADRAYLQLRFYREALDERG
ncbi:hypothetical protein CJ204_11165 [Corynebacterium xerosis]|uniref:Uncharacterized protein n=1 Tax=Corynebacterium xerosis TaxID=1725 RepID=A0A2N6SWE1_9CORY|nr:hypothetical protein [Corynebacterium xerosis]PMC61391.1 hypothetical protein CJ204_11165 [Corynebacterium xerosis]